MLAQEVSTADSVLLETEVQNLEGAPVVGVGLLALGCSYRGGLSAAFTQQLLLRAMCLGEKLLDFVRVLPSQDTSILHHHC